MSRLGLDVLAKQRREAREQERLAQEQQGAAGTSSSSTSSSSRRDDRDRDRDRSSSSRYDDRDDRRDRRSDRDRDYDRSRSSASHGDRDRDRRDRDRRSGEYDRDRDRRRDAPTTQPPPPSMPPPPPRESMPPPAPVHPSRRANPPSGGGDSATDKAREFMQRRFGAGGRTPGGAGGAGGKRPRSVSPDRDEIRRAKGYQENEWNDKAEARQWYEGGDEFGGGGSLGELEGGNPFDGTYSSQRLQERKDVMLKAMSSKLRPGSLRQQQRKADQDKWIESRMFAGGALAAADREDEVEEDVNMVRLIVHKPSPPFLEEGIMYSTKRDLVLPVKDLGCDLYENAKKGSALLRFVRDQRERKKADADALDNAGSMLAKIETGVDKEAEAREERRRIRRERLNMTQQEIIDEEKEEARKAQSFASTVKDEKWSGATAFSSQKIRAQRESLPVYQCREELLKLIRENDIIILVGETGSGKTTQIAQYLYEAGYCTPGEKGTRRIIGCTQPRRVAAMSVAKRVAEEVGTPLGEKVGYSIRFEDCTSENTLIKYMTDGVLLRETMRDPDINHYSAIIMDEAHERSLNTDVLFGIMKACVGRRRDLKLIVTSATMDAAKFSSFFCYCPVFTVPGRTFPVDILYQQTNVADYVNEAVKQAIKIHLQAGAGDILIFMTGQEEIEVGAEWIKRKLEEHDPEMVDTLLILPIYSLLPSEMQAKIFSPAPPGVRKCILATNIAETSLTVDGIYYVIDTGFCKLKVFNPKTGMDSLTVFPESQAAARQRAGRAGRTGPGKCFRLFTEYQFNREMLPMTVPEIQRTSLASVILLLKSLGVKNLLHFEFMDPPPQDNMTNSMYQLWMLGALDDKGELTAVGHDMTELPVDPAMSKALLHSCDVEDCAEEVLTVMACLSSQSKIFIRPNQQAEKADQVREKFVVAESDHLTLLNAYKMFQQNGRSAGWCTEHFINYKAIKRVEEVRVQLREILVKKRKSVRSSEWDWDPVKRCICAGFFPNTAKRRGMDSFYVMLTGVPCSVHPSSALFNGSAMPDYVIYHELIYTQKEYMNNVTVMDAQWVADIAPKFFEVRERGVMGGGSALQGRNTPSPPPPVPAVAARPRRGGKIRREEEDSDDEDGGRPDLTNMSAERAIEAVMGRRKPKQQIAEIGEKAPAAGAGAGLDRRATPARTPAALARPGTPGYRRRGF